MESEEIEGLLKINMKKPESSPLKKIIPKLPDEDLLNQGVSRQ